MKITQVKKNLIFDKKRLYLDFTASGLLHQGIEKKIYKMLKLTVIFIQKLVLIYSQQQNTIIKLEKVLKKP